jgi:hypothetical protein
MSKEHEDLTEHIQKDCHDYIDALRKHKGLKKMSHQDGVNVYLYQKLAELQLRIAQLESKIYPPQ